MKCVCGHRWPEHVPLPGHPDGAIECQVEDCECGRFRPQLPERTFERAKEDRC